MRTLKHVAAMALLAMVLTGCLTAGHFGTFRGSTVLAHFALWGGLAVVVLGRQRRGANVIVVGIVLAISGFASGVMFVVIERQLVVETAQHGDSIVSALQAFRSDKGGYPNALEELVPAYLGVIPSTRMPGVRSPRFWYETTTDNFRLGFRSTSRNYCSRSNLEEWNCDAAD